MASQSKQGFLTSTADRVQLDVSDQAGAVIQLTGTWSGTITFEGAADGVAYVALTVSKSSTTTQSTTATSNGIYYVPCAGLNVVSARFSSYSSGTAAVTIRSAPGSAATITAGSGGGGGGGTSSAFGDPFPSTGTAAGFIDNGGNMAGGTLDASGYLKVNVAAGSSGNAAASATGAAVPADADYQGIKDPSGNLIGMAGSNLDYDTGAGSVAQTVMGIALPASGGPVAGGTSTNPLAVTGTGTAGTANAGVVTVQGIASMTKLLVTPDSVALPANQSVNLAQVAGTNTVTAGVAGTQAVGGNVATNVAIGTNPINNGAQAVSSENAAVTTGRMVQLVADLVGKLIVLPYSNPENFVSGVITSAMTGTTTTSLLAAPASGLRNYITQITVSNASTTVPTDILIQDGSGGTTLYVIPAPAGTGTGTGAAGATLTFPTPLRQPTTATAIFVANVTTGSSTKVSASGYKGA